MKHTTFLVATDFSETGIIVVQKALQMAQSHQAVLHVIHVIESSWYQVQHKIESIRAHSWQTLSERFPVLDKNHFHCMSGNVPKQISKTAEQIGASLLIIGSSGEDYPLKELFVGSTTKNIIRNSALPVLVIKNDLPFNPTRILLPTDLSEYSKITIHQTKDLFPHAKLLMLNFFDVPFEGRLRVYGFDDEDIIDYQMQIRQNHNQLVQTFRSSLHLSEDKSEVMIQKGPISPQLFLELSNSFNIDLVSTHTTGEISFFALELLEESSYDVLVFKF